MKLHEDGIYTETHQANQEELRTSKKNEDIPDLPSSPEELDQLRVPKPMGQFPCTVLSAPKASKRSKNTTRGVRDYAY